MNLQSADELFKINDDYPQETKDQLLKAKADYIKSMAASQEAVLSTQRINYNTILSQAYFNQYLFEEAIPSARALVDELNKNDGLFRGSDANGSTANEGFSVSRRFYKTTGESRSSVYETN
ncbi:MAG: hypothetical protein IPJ20_03805 [Flammeovirgaceae bacterium]|nr:hypothetical protein [Flammeovirgaceae bacterium]